MSGIEAKLSYRPQPGGSYGKGVALNLHRRCFGMYWIAALLLALSVASGEIFAAELLKAGAKLETLTAGKITYRAVVVRSVSARTVMITHAGGMASVKLRDLAPELQAAFGYDPAAESASEQALQNATAARQAQAAAATAARKAAAARVGSKLEQLLQEFGRPAAVNAAVDLRPRFRELELHAKDQGRRPSCAVFAVVSALEYLNAERSGRAEKFSEEYLVWATGKSIQRTGPNLAAIDEDADAGFALTEVVTALRAYGIPLQSSMPNTIGRQRNVAAEPTPEIIAEARNRTQVAILLVPGRDTATQLNNVVQVLNAGIPVAIGCGWPRLTNMRAALLNSQPPIPGYGHAVTLVGYTCETGRIEDATFIFKNSWGAAWGANGYGFATYAYLVKNLNTAVVLEVGGKG